MITFDESDICEVLFTGYETEKSAMLLTTLPQLMSKLTAEDLEKMREELGRGKKPEEKEEDIFF